MKSPVYQSIVLKGIQSRVDPLRGHLTQLKSPSGGWIRALRQGLGLTYREAGARLGSTAQTFNALERSEAAGTISLRSLEKCAEALGCELVIAMVPRADRDARAHASKSRNAVAHSMALENQAVDADPLKKP